MRHYGLNLGDLVVYSGILAKVEKFDYLDNNRAYLRSDNHPGLLSAVAEWCTKVIISDALPGTNDIIVESDGSVSTMISLNLEKPGYGTVRSEFGILYEVDLKTIRLLTVCQE